MKYRHLLFCLLLGMALQAQIKIGDNPQNIDPSSVLELESSSRVLVITRVNTAEMSAIAPSAGALVYNTDVQCIHYYTGTEWKDICDAVAGSITFSSEDGTVVITSTSGNNYDLKVGEITGMNIINETVFGADIATATIGERQLAPNSVGSSELQDNTVGKAEIQEAAVGTLEIIDGSIQPEDMQAGAFDQLLTTDAAGTVVWLNKSDLGGTQADPNTITGAGTTADPIKVADTVLGDILANATLINNHITADGDLSSTNETLTAAVIQGNELVITESGNETRVDLSGFNNTGSDNQNLETATLTGQNLTINIQNGNPTTADLSALATDTELANAITASENADNDQADDNELITNAELAGTDLIITDAGASWTVPLASLSGSNGSDGSIIDPNGGTFIEITGAGTGPSPYVINNTFTEVDGSISNEVITASTLTGNTLTITEGGNDFDIDLTGLGGGGSDGVVSIVELNGTDLDFTGTGGGFNGSIDIASIDTTLDETAVDAFVANNGYLITEVDGSITNEIITGSSLVGTTLTISEGVNDFDIDLSGLGGGTPSAADVTFDPYLTLGSTNTQAAIEELKDELTAAILLAGASDPNDELITNFSITGTTLNILEAGTNFPLDLDPVFATNAVLSANLALKENTGNKSSDVNLADATNTLFPTELAVKTYVDTQIAGAAADDDITAVSFDGTNLTVTEGATSFFANISALDDSAAIALKEDTANKSTDTNLADATNTLFPTELAVKTYVDTQIAGAAADDDITAVSFDGTNLTVTEGATSFFANISALDNSAAIALKEDTANKSNDGTLAGNSATDFPTEQAVKTYVDTQVGAATGHTGTTGSIFFADTDNTPTENNSQLFWDNVNNKLYLGPQISTTGDVKLNVNGTTRTQGIKNSSGSAGTPAYRFTDNLDTGMFLADASGILGFSADNQEAMRIDISQNVGIGPTFASGTAIAARLHVDGDIRGDDIFTNGTQITPDYVFQKYFLGNSILKDNYAFQTLAQIEDFIKTNHHLPGIKSAEEVKQDGFWNLSESNLQNLEKIEELFLHTIEQEKKIDQLKTENESLSAELQSLRKDMDEIKALLNNKN